MLIEEIEVKIRRLEALEQTELARVVQIINQAFGKYHWLFPNQRTSLEGFAREIGDSDLVLLVAPSVNEIVGVAYIRGENQELYFGMAAVDPARQGRGLGGQLLKAVEEFAHQRAFARVRLKAVAEMGNVLYYTKRGYQIVSQEIMAEGEWDSLHSFTVATMQKEV